MANYRIELFGTGDEMCIGTVSDKVWDYIQKEFNGDCSEYVDAFTDDNVPMEYRVANDCCCMYECDDLHHDEGCWASCYNVVVTDTDTDKVVFRSTDSDKVIRQYVDEESIRNDVRHICVWSSVSKGCFLTGEFETDEDFDPEKLQMYVRKTNYCNDKHYNKIIVGFDYDGEEIDCEFDSTTGKGDDITIYNLDEE